MLPLEPLLTFGFLYAADRLRDRQRWNIFAAGLVFVGLMIALELVFPMIVAFLMTVATTSATPPSLPIVTWRDAGHWMILYVVAVVVLGLLARFEDTLAAWLAIFIAGFAVLAFVI